jgi:chloramphenicol-sensitive protein RarD
MTAADLTDRTTSVRAARRAAVAHRRARQGVVYGVLSYGLWGLIPLYFKLVARLSPLEVLAHRVFWSFLLLAGAITLLRRWPHLLRAVGQRQVVLALSASTALLACNWLTYIYAVFSNQVVEASLGYFLTPLVNVLLGVAILHERLRAWQIASVVLAGVGVAILGAPPIAVTLAVTFALYGLLRKTVAADGLEALFVETTLLAPLSAGYLVFLAATGRAGFVTSDPRMCLLLASSGVVTAAPLLLFAASARRLQMATLGFLQYLAPSIQFLLAVLAFGERLSPVQWAALALIWIAVGIYCIDSLRVYRRQRGELLRAAPAPVDG